MSNDKIPKDQQKVDRIYSEGVEKIIFNAIIKYFKPFLLSYETTHLTISNFKELKINYNSGLIYS